MLMDAATILAPNGQIQGGREILGTNGEPPPYVGATFAASFRTPATSYTLQTAVKHSQTHSRLRVHQWHYRNMSPGLPNNAPATSDAQTLQIPDGNVLISIAANHVDAFGFETARPQWCALTQIPTLGTSSKR